MIPDNAPPEAHLPDPDSPRWNWTTKLIVGLALVALALWLLVQFKGFLGPILFAFLLAYLFYPVANAVQKAIKIPWRLSVTAIYLAVVLGVVGLLTWGGLALFGQLQNLITFFEKNIDKLPAIINDLAQRTIALGPLQFNLTGINWNNLTNEIVGAIQPVLGQVGTIAGTVASGAASIFLWLAIVMLVSYFLLAETEGTPNRIINVRIPGYTEDLKRMGEQLSRIWNAFIRGQLIVELVTVVVYTIFLGSMGMQFFFGLALIAALGRFIPYVGAWITWISYALVALLQGSTIFGLPSGVYALIILGGSMIIDTLLDNVVVPKVMSENLKVHPALVLVGALIAVDLLGIIGIILAAPVLATLKLLFGYIVSKLSDQDPWRVIDTAEPIQKARWIRFLKSRWESFVQWIQKAFARIKQSIKNRRSKDSDPASPPDEEEQAG